MHTLSLTLWVLAATPSVSSVVVYPDRAQVTRAQTVTCTGRDTLARFEELPPAADPSSFRARADRGTVEGLLASEHTRQTRYGAEREKQEKQRVELERELAALEHARARALALDSLGSGLMNVALGRIRREFTEAKPDTRAWGTALDTALGSRLRASAEREAQASKLRTTSRALAELSTQEQRTLAASARIDRSVEVRLDCPSGTQARVELTYLVGGASWQPAYEARADEQGQRVELSTYATVKQASGEDWKEAQLVLSTAVPDENATPPELRPLFVSSRERKVERKVLVSREERQEHAQSGASTPPSGGESLHAKAQGLSVQLTVPERANVPGDGSEVRLRVARTPLQASFAWRTIPKLYPVVFRVARLTNTAPFPLLAGPVDVFRQTGFLGRQPLERVAQGAPFELTFGIEEGLRVERQVVEEVARDTGLFGGKRRFRYAYRFEVANYRKTPEQLEVSEHIPVSELEDVKVELDAKKTTAGYALDAADGIATWKLPLAPAEKRTVELVFHVDVPSSYDSGGLE
ncbi:mucoidy inhibitor MuiA family protein [Hyalangium minutum]|uniref:Aspartate ammonia-lyase n=1 Tax=Hyalangium minutum TaxID=394096 RepID=A0A085WUD8_9BACT|nr:mucoidy inhibitor MuiA family protein [Hyalangium minutum]KFE71301.1 Aspartate ammonia-lyase [Hyalangium minutum]